MTINDREWLFLAQQTGMSAPFNDMYFHYLRDLGYTGTLQDMIAAYGYGLTPSKGGGLVWPTGERTMKLAFPNNSNSIYVAQKDAAGDGYVSCEVRRNFVVSNGSIGGTSDIWGRGRVFHIAEAIIGNNAAVATSGTWTSVNYTTVESGFPTADWPSWSPSSLATVYTTTQGDYKDYEVVTDADGKFTATFGGRENSVANMEVSDADSSAIIATGVSLRVASSADRRLLQMEFTHPEGAGTYNVRFKHNIANTNRLQIIGVNTVRLTEPDAVKPGAGVVYNFGTSVRSANYYSNSQGEQSHAFLHDALNTLGGGVHGEVLDEPATITFDGVAFDPADRGWGTELIFEQISTIPWDGDPNPMRRTFGFVADGKPAEFGWPSTPVLSVGYLGMSTAYVTDVGVGFTEVVFPEVIDTSTDDTAYPIATPGATVVQQNPTTGQTIRMYSSAALDPAFEEWFVKAEFVNLYCKLYCRAVNVVDRALTKPWRTVTEYRYVDPDYPL